MGLWAFLFGVFVVLLGVHIWFAYLAYWGNALAMYYLIGLGFFIASIAWFMLYHTADIIYDWLKGRAENQRLGIMQGKQAQESFKALATASLAQSRQLRSMDLQNRLQRELGLVASAKDVTPYSQKVVVDSGLFGGEDEVLSEEDFRV